MNKIILLIFTTLICAGAFNAPAQVSATYLSYVDSADNYIKKERYVDAERMILKALKTEPANPSNYLLFSNLGIVRTHLGNIEGALEAYDVGLSRAPKSTTLLSNRAYTYLAINKTEEALADFNSALQKDSLLNWPLKMRGYILLAKGDLKGAKRDFECLQRNFPKETDAQMGLGKLALSENRIDDALLYFKKVLEKNNDEEVYFYLATSYLQKDRLNEAIETIREGLKKFPEAGDLFLLRARWHQLNYRNEEALIDKKLAEDNHADPQLIEAYFPTGRK